jgi:hypothetical protein
MTAALGYAISDFRGLYPNQKILASNKSKSNLPCYVKGNRIASRRVSKYPKIQWTLVISTRLRGLSIGIAIQLAYSLRMVSMSKRALLAKDSKN